MDGIATQCGMVRQATGGGGGGGGGWTPSDLGAALLLWLDASDQSTITTSGSAVTQWDDKSGNGNHATQSNASDQPQSGLSTINGLNVIDIDGNDFVITAPISFSDVSVISLFAHSLEDFIVLGTDTTSVFLGVGQNGSAAQNQSSGVVFSQLWIDSTELIIPTRNDFFTAVDQQTKIVAITGTGNQTRPITPWAFPSDAFKPAGSVGEYILTDGIISQSDREKAEGYLAWKWGKVSNLPSSHPYKSAAP